MTGRSALTVAFNKSSLLIQGVIWNGFLFINEAFFSPSDVPQREQFGGLKLFGHSSLEITQIMGPDWLSVTQVSKPEVALLLPTQRLQAGGSVNLEQNLAQSGVLSFVLPWRIFLQHIPLLHIYFNNPVQRNFADNPLLNIL